MAKRRKKKNNYTFLIVIGVFLLVLVIIAIAILSKQPDADPNATATASAATQTSTPAPTALPQQSILPTVDQTASVEPTDQVTQEPTQGITPIPSIQQTELNIANNKMFIIHLTVDSGELQPSEDEKFDDDFYLTPTEEPDEYDYSSTKVMVLITDYRGNSRIARYDSTSISLKIHRNVAGGILSDEDALAELSIRVDGAQNLHLTWADQTIRITAEDDASQSCISQSDITVTARPIGLRDKSDYQQ